MTKEEIRLQVAISCIQGILEAKHGIIGEIVPAVAVAESLRIADEFVKQWDKKSGEEVMLQEEFSTIRRWLENIVQMIDEGKSIEDIRVLAHDAAEYIKSILEKK